MFNIQGLQYLKSKKRLIEGFSQKTSAEIGDEYKEDSNEYSISQQDQLIQTRHFIESSSNNDYTERFIKMKNNKLGYITDKNVFKYIPTNEIFNTIKDTYPNPDIIEVNFDSDKYSDEGYFLGTNPDFLVGKPMTDKNFYINYPTESNIHIQGNVDTDSLQYSWKGCYKNLTDYFNEQQDLRQGYDSNTIRRCAIRTADIGSSLFYIGRDSSNNYTCNTSKHDVTEQTILDNIKSGMLEKTGSVIQTSTLEAPESGYQMAAGIMNNGKIALGNMISTSHENYGNNVKNYVMMDMGNFNGLQNCDPIYGAKINVIESTYGGNCPNVEQNNWIDNIKNKLNYNLNKQSVAIFSDSDVDPSPDCNNKGFSAKYNCSINDSQKIIDTPNPSTYAMFDCESENEHCSNINLSLSDTGNLVLTKEDNNIWQSNTDTTGIALESYNAQSGKYGRNYLKPGEFLYEDEFIGSPSGNCSLKCKNIDGKCSLVIVYYLWACRPYDGSYSVIDGSSGYITDIDGYGAAYKLSEYNNDKSLNGKVVHFNKDMELMQYPMSMIDLSNNYIDLGNYSQPSSSNIKIIDNSNLDNCKQECNNLQNCYGFIHYEDTKKCNLKNKDDIFPHNIKRVLANDAKMFIRKYNITESDTCSKDIIDQNISSSKLINLPRGEDMKKNTNCGIYSGTILQEQNVKTKKTELDSTTNTLIDRHNEINKMNNYLDNKLNSLNDEIDKNVYTYNQYESKKDSPNNNNINHIKNESELIVSRENLLYMTWTTVAALSVLVIIKVSK